MQAMHTRVRGEREGLVEAVGGYVRVVAFCVSRRLVGVSLR